MFHVKAAAGCCFFLALTCLLASPVGAVQWTASVDQRNGLPVVSIAGAVAITSDFVFWKRDWSWAGLSAEFKVLGPLEYAIVGKNQGLNFELSGHAAQASEHRLVWTFDLDARSTTTDVVGGGISFKFDLTNVGSRLGEPELLTGNRGWAWGPTGGTRMEMRFEPPMAAVYFERGQKSEIRAFFYQGEVPRGQRHHVATLTVSGDMAIGPTTLERFGLDDPTTWPTDILDWPIAPWNISPVDLSFLNAQEKPAGKHGFLRSIRDTLVFEDGSPARFWGTNLTAFALFATDRENVKQQARRLSELGFNLVRLHHHDSPWVNPNIFGDGKLPDTKSLNPVMLERLDWWIECLKKEGIYIWLDLHVQRNFKPGDDIEQFAEIAKGRLTADLKGFNYVNSSIQAAMLRFNEAYVSHHNPFTGLRYKDDPAIIALQLTNENDLTHHYGNALLPDKKVPHHNALFMALAEEFAAKHSLPKDKVWRSWEHGPSKIFLNDLENRFNTDMIRSLRTLGAQAPIVATATWGANPLSSLPALTVGDMIAVHSYGSVGSLERNPLYSPNLMHWIAAAQVVGRPLVVPEWNVEPFPTADRHSIPLYLAGSASLQGWDAVMQFAYSQQPLSNRGSPSNWHAFNDPGLIATLPAAALLYRRKDVQEARSTYVFVPSREQLFGQLISPANAVALRTAAEKGKLMIAMPQTPELPWLEKSEIPDGAKVITNPNLPLLDADAAEALSDTGELRRNWDKGTYIIDTPRTQAATGWIGGKEIVLADVQISAVTRNATVAVQSLDENPISKTRAIMISLGARSVPKAGHQVPFYSEPVTGRLAIRAIPGLKLYTQHGVARDTRELPARYANGRYHIELDRELLTYWLMLK